VNSSVRRFHSNEVPTYDYRLFRSTETKKSECGKILADVAATHIEPSTKNFDPISSTDPLGVGTCISKVLEGVTSDASESSSSIRIGIEYDSKVETADKENLENLIRGVSVSSSTHSLEKSTKAIATNVSPFHKSKADDQDD